MESAHILDPAPRAFFFDVDGTLVSHKTKRVPPSTVEALEELRRRGCKVFVATGRSMSEFHFLPLQDLEFDGYVLVGGRKRVMRIETLSSPTPSWVTTWRCSTRNSTRVDAPSCFTSRCACTSMS